ncbi:ArsR/SmtB family transcription factor [Quadrisphaera sp. KR29]|uniref:ArsR/SmtB family transcription factor n=1 Tax=Quadrisphaera sp. KR29 TaxID=3461391 RepID=UPI0040447945
MSEEPGLAEAAELFKILGSASRLQLLRLIGQQPRTVGELVDLTGMAQPLVSQHLRTLRQVGLASAARTGREVTYSLTDDHVTDVIADALLHVQEERSPLPADHADETTDETGTTRHDQEDAR